MGEEQVRHEMPCDARNAKLGSAQLGCFSHTHENGFPVGCAIHTFGLRGLDRIRLAARRLRNSDAMPKSLMRCAHHRMWSSERCSIVLLTIVRTTGQRQACENAALGIA